MAWGSVTIGGIVLRETVAAEETSSGLRLAGQESHPPSTRAHVEVSHENIVELADRVVPVVLTDKVGLSGFYRVVEATSTLTHEHGGTYVKADWSIALERIGRDRDVEIESRLPMIGRVDEIAGTQVPVFWHAPAVGVTSYLTGATVPNGSVVRQSSDGPVTAYTGLPATFPPRWTIGVADYLKGAARILVDGQLRLGRTTPPAAVWEMHNGLVRVASGADGAVTVSCWDGGEWRSAKTYTVTINGAPLTGQPAATILRNDPEETVLRLTYPGIPGRTTLDLCLRRGARFVTGTIKRHSAATIGVARTSAETATVVTGGLRAAAADADGNRFVLGSSRLVTTATGTAAISKASVTAFDFFAGHEVGTPAAGDAFADLLGQYLSAGGERATVVIR